MPGLTGSHGGVQQSWTPASQPGMRLRAPPCRACAVRRWYFCHSVSRLSMCAGLIGNARHRADLHALRLVEVAHAFGALVRIDLVDLRAQVDGLVRALGLAHIAVDALVGNHQCHAEVLPRDFPAHFWHYRRLHECFPVQAPDHPDCDAGRRIGGGVPGAGNPAGKRRPDPDGPGRFARSGAGAGRQAGHRPPARRALLELGQRHADGRPGPELRLQHAGVRTGARAPHPHGAAGADGHGHHLRAGAGRRHLCRGAAQQARRRRRDGPVADRHRHPELLVRHPADPAVLGAPALVLGRRLPRLGRRHPAGHQGAAAARCFAGGGAVGDPGAHHAFRGARGVCAKTSCARRAPRACRARDALGPRAAQRA